MFISLKKHLPQSTYAQKRLIGDLWKFCRVAIFIVFVTLVPDTKKAAGAPLVLAATIFSFLLACLMYFQYFNFSAKKKNAGGRINLPHFVSKT